MDKMELDTLIRRYTIHHEDEITLEKIEKSHKEKLEPIVIYGIETPKELEEKKNRINGITRDLEVIQQVLENLRTEKTEFLNKRKHANQVFFKEYEKEIRENFQKNEKQKEIDNSYLDLLENLKV